MNLLEFKTFGRDCFAVFSAREPGSRAWELWAEMCADVPLAASPWIRKKILEMDALPRNFGKSVLSLFREWHAEKGGTATHQCCPDCDPHVPGFFFAWKHHGERRYSYLCRCLCNHDPEWSRMRKMSKAQAKRDGYTVAERGEGPAAMEKLLTVPSGYETPTTRAGAMAQELAKRPQWDNSVRHEHAEQLSMEF